MQMMELVIQNLLLFYFIVTYLGICAGLMITENLLIRRGNRRGLRFSCWNFTYQKRKHGKQALYRFSLSESSPAGWNPTWNSNIEAIRSLQMLIR